MLHLSASRKYYLYSGPADMHKGFDGLSGIVKSQMAMNTLNGAVFVFLKRRRTHIKMPTLCKALHNLGRKNYLFAGSHEAAQRAAMIYSLLSTCKLHDINPYEWLKDVLQRMHLYTTAGIEGLLPQNWVKLLD